MLTSVLPTPNKFAAKAKRASLWDRMMTACARSFELLAESKSRYPMDI